MSENAHLYVTEGLAGHAERLEPLHVHSLPVAPTFIGREREMKVLSDFWQEGNGVMSLVGLGGAGKTAVLERFLREVTKGDQPDGILVWSFYDDPDTNAFLQTAFAYITGGQVAEAKGAGWFHLLKESLASDRRFLLVMDGLERVQRPQTDASGIYGELEDPLLKGLLVRLASGNSLSKALITSRFPISDVERWNGRGYSVLDIDQLSEAAAIFVLRSHNVEGTDEELTNLIAGYGRHALTLDLLGGAIQTFFKGAVKNAPRFDAAHPSSTDFHAARLSAVLRMYEQNMSARELDLLSRLCVFRFGVSTDALEGIFARSQKEAVSGSLAGASREALMQWLEDLVNAHLLYKESGDRFTVHPAVRDHFYRLFRDPSAIHGAVSEHLMSLSNRPGIGLPTEKASLDLLEELVFHAIKAGNIDEALEIYGYRMGGNDHLNTHLGEYARTFRIMQAFKECPDPSAMYHCLRAFGDFEGALKWRPQNRYIRIANGDLTALKIDSSDRTQRVARFLQGEEVTIPDRMPDLPISAAMLQLIRGNLDDAQRLAENDLRISMFQDDMSRARLVLAEVARRHGTLRESKEMLESAATWILGSGSHEHLCVLHLCRGRLLIDEGHLTSALAALDEGIQIAEEADFKLFLVDLLAEKARALRAKGNLEEAESAAQRACDVAGQVDVQYVWGAVAAGRLLAEILAQRDKLQEAKARLDSVLVLQRRINAPDTIATERQLRDLRARLT